MSPRIPPAAIVAATGKVRDHAMHAYREPRDAAHAIEVVLREKDLRSADKANMQTMLKQVRRGNPLDYQQRYNLWAYVSRYSNRDGAG
jgi:hypothetical protein